MFFGFMSCDPEDNNVNPLPKLVLEEDTVSVSAAAGDYVVRFTVENPIESEVVVAGSESQWLSITVQEETSVGFHVESNPEEKSREALVVLKYADMEEAVTVVQDGAEPVEEPEGYQFMIDVKLNGYTVDVTVTPEDESVRYFIGHLSQERFDELSGVWPDAAQKDIDQFIGLLEVLGMTKDEILISMLKDGVQTTSFSDLDPGMTHYIYACAVDDDGKVLPNVAVSDFETEPAGDASAVTFTFNVTDITTTGATVEFIPSDATVLYTCGVAVADKTGEELRQELIEQAEGMVDAGFYETSGDYIKSRSVCGNSSFSPNLEDDTEYRPYAIAVNEDGVLMETVSFGEVFKTDAIEFGSADIDITCMKYFNGDELADLNFYIYGQYEGTAAAQMEITVGEDIETYYFSAFYNEWGEDFMDLEAHPDESMIGSLQLLGREKGENTLMSFRWDEDVVYMVVGVDKDGNYTKVVRKKIRCTEDGAAPVEEFED